MLRFEIRVDADNVFAHSADWNAIAGGIPFRQTHWLSPWWRYMRGSHQAMIVTAHCDDRLVAALPLYRVDGGRTLGVMGDGLACSDFLGVLSVEDNAAAIAGEMGEYLGSVAGHASTGWDMLDFDGAVEGDASFPAFVEGLRRGGCSTHVSSRMHCWRRPRDADWESHIQQHGKTQRRKMRGWTNAINKLEGVRRVHASTADQTQVFLHETIDLHQRRWNAVGEPGSFADPNFRKFFDAMAAAFAEAGRLWVPVIQRDGCTIAGEIDLIGDDGVAYTYSSGYDTDHDDLEPGRLLCTGTLREMYHPSEGAPAITAIDYMRGDEAYKQRFTTQKRSLYRLRAFAPEIPARLRSAAYRTTFEVKQWLRKRAGKDLIEVASL